MVLLKQPQEAHQPLLRLELPQGISSDARHTVRQLSAAIPHRKQIPDVPSHTLTAESEMSDHDLRRQIEKRHGVLVDHAYAECFVKKHTSMELTLKAQHCMSPVVGIE